MGVQGAKPLGLTPFKVLFITSTRLGDAVLSTGLLDYVLREHSDARVTVACGPVAAGVFSRMPGLERLLIVEKRRFDLHWLAVWRACVGTRWDLAVDLRGSALTLLVRAKRRAIMRGGRRAGHRLGHLAGVLDVPTGCEAKVSPAGKSWDANGAASCGWTRLCSFEAPNIERGRPANRPRETI